ncbi:MAG: hypothetical protein K6A41_06045, partial [Bacteroidales bacterium]|nr:hypothetical protein [Bacteroidales bacterium]
MKIIELYNLRKEIYETIHTFLLEHKWCTEESKIDRMGYKKRKNLRLTSDFIRLFLGTIVVIKTKGTKKDFDDLMNRLLDLLLNFFDKCSDLEDDTEMDSPTIE